MHPTFKPGDKIRSFHFAPRPGRGDCYFEGVVTTASDDSGEISFVVTRDVWKGVDVSGEPTNPIGSTCTTHAKLFTGEYSGRLQKLEN